MGAGLKLRNELEGRDVQRPDDGEVAAIEGGDRRLLEPLGDRDDGRIDEAERLVGVTSHERAYARVVLEVEWRDEERAVLDAGENRIGGPRASPSAGEMIELNEYRSGDDDDITRRDELDARAVVFLSRIECRVNDTRVAHQGHGFSP